MRSASIGWVVVLCGCFEGGNATGLPCTEDSQCGNQRCIDQVCGGPSATTTTTAPGTDTAVSTSMGDTTVTPNTSASDSTSDSPSTTSASSDDDSSSGGATPACTRPPDRSQCADGAPAFSGGSVNGTAYGFEGDNPTSVTVGDYDDNGTLDLAVGCHSDRTVVLLAGSGDGGFGVLAISPAFTAFSVDMIATDVECDGTTEFFSVGYMNTLESVSFDGEVFTPREPILVEPNGFSLAVADLAVDPDGWPDIAVAQGAPVNRVTLLVNEGGVLSPNAFAAGAAGATPWELLPIDLDPSDDEDLRLVVADGDSNNGTLMGPANDVVRVLEVGGRWPDVTLSADVSASPISQQLQNPYAAAWGNFHDSPDELELVVAEKVIHGGDQEPFEASIATGRLVLYAFDGMAFTQIQVLDVGVGPRSLGAADMNCDGFTDLVVSNAGDGASVAADGTVEFVRGSDGGLLTAEPVFSGVTGGGTRIGIGDFDGDGRPEAAVPDWGGRRVVVVDLEP